MAAGGQKDQQDQLGKQRDKAAPRTAEQERDAHQRDAGDVEQLFIAADGPDEQQSERDARRHFDIRRKIMPVDERAKRRRAFEDAVDLGGREHRLQYREKREYSTENDDHVGHSPEAGGTVDVREGERQEYAQCGEMEPGRLSRERCERDRPRYAAQSGGLGDGAERDDLNKSVNRRQIDR